MKKGLILILFAFYALSSFAQEKLYYQMSVKAIDEDIRLVQQKNLSMSEKMDYYSARFLGAPYVLQCEGDGPNARYETEPLLNLKEVNCMTYCEIVMALSLADYYEDMFNILQHIRYRQGIIGMATRNHYTMADWLPANAWCLDDVTQQVGGNDATKLTRTITHKSFFGTKGITDIPVCLPDRELTISYIPKAKLAANQTQLQTGDIVALIQNREGIFSAHMLLIIKKGGQTFFRHASWNAKKVIDTPFEEYMASISKKNRILGMSFMRMKSEIQWRDGNYSHGKFLLP